MSKLNGTEYENYRKQFNLSISSLLKSIDISYNTYMKFIKDPDNIHISSYRKLEKFYKENINPNHEVPTVDIKKPKVKLKNMMTVYLESVEDIINELNSGSIIYIQDTKYSFQMIDNIIVKYSEGEPVSINTPILCDERYYVLKPEPIKLKVGKRYYDTEGNIVTIFDKLSEDIFRGIFVNDTSDHNIATYTFNGKSNESSNTFDLIEEV